MAGALNQNIDLATALAGFSKTLFGTSTNTITEESGGTTTKQTQLSADAITELLRQLTEGGITGGGANGIPGLAALAQGEKSAGLYNSSTAAQLMQKNLAQISGQAALASAPTVTTSPAKRGVVKQQVPGALSTTAGKVSAGTLGLALLGNKKVRDKLGISDLFSEAGNPFGFGSTPDVITAGSEYGAVTDAASSLTDLISSGGGENIAYIADTLAGDALGSFGTDIASSFAADIAGSFVPDIAGELAGGGLDLAGNFLGDVGGELAGEAAGNAVFPGVFTIANVISGGQLGDAVGEVIGSIPVVGDIFKSCFITTAVMAALGKPDDCAELTTLRKFRDTWLLANKPEDIKEYYAIAPGIVRAIDKIPEAGNIWKSMYSRFIVPSLSYINIGENEKAYTTYREMVQEAKRLAEAV